MKTQNIKKPVEKAEMDEALGPLIEEDQPGPVVTEDDEEAIGHQEFPLRVLSV